MRRVVVDDKVASITSPLTTIVAGTSVVSVLLTPRVYFSGRGVTVTKMSNFDALGKLSNRHFSPGNESVCRRS